MPTSTHVPPASVASNVGPDRLTRFLLQAAGVRGVHVQLDETWARIRERAGDDVPVAVTELLGEAAVAAALFTGHAKIEGRLSVQLRGDGPVRTLFAECTAAGTLRGIAQVRPDAAPMPRDLRALGAEAVLAITIENPGGAGREPVRYQGLVALASESLAGAFEDYFRQSEQLPTRLLLAADGHRAAGLMLQKLPGDGGDDDGWDRACALFETLSPTELLVAPATTLLQRLFQEDGVEVLGERQLRFACSCSRDRVAAMLQSLGEEEARAAAAAGDAEIRCEFCGEQYRFGLEEIAALFPAGSVAVEAPERLQ
ncbi:Hsp33 family molecular chaperone HslO [Luteimonas sp. 50]|uniref:Hsp33 family molecular chaperone HslO n=1 Tax=Cognatiluteimonas sedimenti TaxID=2927791 RepID=A0ABT0A441_9GAMM|nr:Hsp33 family molecular chaperone HslO [Lysobacter sedimenti]MCJ0825744.1 Hsp33 family molecular chaperone HslO [Lysobacter sedimenti]